MARSCNCCFSSDNRTQIVYIAKTKEEYDLILKERNADKAAPKSCVLIMLWLVIAMMLFGNVVILEKDSIVLQILFFTLVIIPIVVFILYGFVWALT